MTTDTTSAPDGTVPNDAGPVETHYRYPGSPPFQDDELDRLLFKGRQQESDEVLHTILSADLFVLFAASGMGKSSLLNAGVLHHLRAADYQPFPLRMNDPTRAPMDLIRDSIAATAEADPDIDVLNVPSMPPLDEAETLWDYLAALEVWRGNTLAEPVLIFDQFEELFTLPWPEAVRTGFITEFGEVARGHRMTSTTDAGERATAPRVKLVIVIREDSLGELEAMAEHVPHILRRRFRLGPLDITQARQAIVEPAMEQNPLLGTRRFGYQPEAADEILRFLGAQAASALPTHQRGVDPSQLQLVCQYVERTILPRKQPDATDELIEITTADLGGQEGLQEILGDFYRRTLELFEGDEHANVRRLCEEGLINRNGRRLSLEVGEITDTFDVSEDVLERLVTERLLRGERRVGSVYYELAHDTLVAPIGDYRAAREEEARAALAAEEAEAQRAQRRRRRQIVNAAVAILVVAVIAALIITRPDDDGPQATMLALGDIQSGEITEPGGDALFAFDALTTEPIDIVVIPGADTALDAAIDVTDPNGATRQQNQLSVGSVERVVVANVTGRYEFAVRAVGTSLGVFEVRIVAADEQDLVLPTEGAPGLLGEIASPGDVGVYSVDLAEGEALVVEVTTEAQAALDAAAEAEAARAAAEEAGDADAAAEFALDAAVFRERAATSLDPLVDVIEPNGVTRRVDAASITLSGDTGRHIILVSGLGDSTGVYQVSVTSGSAVQAMGAGEVLDGQGFSAGVAAYSVAGSTDELLTLEVVPDPALDVVVEVIDPNGSVLKQDLGGPGVSEVQLLSPVEGNHQVTVRRVSGDDAAGFTIGLAAADVRPIELGGSESGTIEAAGDVSVFEFEASGEQAVTALVAPGPGLDVALEISAPDGSLQRTDRNPAGGDEHLTFLTEPGPYRLIVTRSTASSGPFELTMTPAESSITIVEPADGQVGERSVTISGDVQPVDADVWISVQGSSRDSVFFVGGFPVSANSEGRWSAPAAIGDVADTGFTFTITAYAMDSAGSAVLADIDLMTDLNTTVPIDQIPAPLAVATVQYTRAS